MATTRLAYPPPKYPDYLRPVGATEDLMPQARQVILGIPFSTLGADSRALLVIPPDQDRMVLEAVTQALEEKGIGVDVVHEHECGLLPPLERLRKVSAADGWNEVFWRPEMTAMLPSKLQSSRPLHFNMQETGFEEFRQFLDAHNRYDSIIYGWSFLAAAGRLYRNGLGKYGDTYKGAWTLRTHEDLQSRMVGFPEGLWDLIERRTLEIIPSIAQVRVSDPQGTEIWFSVTKEEAELWAQGAYGKGHLELYPLNIHLPRALRGTQRPGNICPRANGVIAGTGNHYGYYPYMKAYVEDGVVRRIEGGGQFGERLREIMYKTKDLQYPAYPRPGYFYVTELAMGTHPKGFRDTAGLFSSYRIFPNVSERARSGVVHWGMGIDSFEQEVVQFARERRLPYLHSWHIHNYLSTYEVDLRGTGEWFKIIDKGHLTVLDDPEVQALAARHGVQTELLSEDWVPTLPGINYPGDYVRDYGRDPAGWIRMEQEGRLPATIGVP